MQQRVVALLLGHFSLAFVSLPSFRSRKASQESTKQERERERAKTREWHNYWLSRALPLSLSLSLSRGLASLRRHLLSVDCWPTADGTWPTRRTLTESAGDS